MGLDSFSFVKLGAVALIFFGVWEVTHARTREEIEAHHAAEAKAVLKKEPAEHRQQ